MSITKRLLVLLLSLLGWTRVKREKYISKTSEFFFFQNVCLGSTSKSEIWIVFLNLHILGTADQTRANILFKAWGWIIFYFIVRQHVYSILKFSYHFECLVCPPIHLRKSFLRYLLQSTLSTFPLASNWQTVWIRSPVILLGLLVPIASSFYHKVIGYCKLPPF